MVTEVSVSEPLVATQIQAVSRAAYALEAELIGCADFPPLRESLVDLQQSLDRFLVYREPESHHIVGVLAFAWDGSAVSITRLVVSPAYVRQGIATALHAHLARHLPQVTGWAVSTAGANTPAVRLYEKLGYTRKRTTMTGEGIALVHFVKKTG